MENKQKVILRKVVELLKATGSFNYVGFYDDLEDFKVAMGQNYPMVLVEDGDETFSDYPQQNLSVTKDLQVNVWLYHNIKKQRRITMLDLQATIEDAIMDDTVLSTLTTDYIWDIYWVRVDKGGWLDNFDYRTPGYSDDRICRRIVFNFQFNTAR